MTRVEVSRPSAPRTAFFGGSFDPPHLGHLAIARAAQAALALDSVLFAPVGAQPLKPQGSTAPFDDRVAMTRLAIAGDPVFDVSLLDAPAPDARPNYTYDTLSTLRRQLPPDSPLFCLMGADSFLSLRHWHRAAEIPFLAWLIVASRPGQNLTGLAAALPEGLTLTEPQRAEIRHSVHPFPPKAATPVPPPPIHPPRPVPAIDAHPSPLPSHQPPAPPRVAILRNQTGATAPFYLLPGLDIDISASAIRETLRCCFSDPASTRHLLPPAVATYIRTHSLYHPTSRIPNS